MIALIAENKVKIAEICRAHRVWRFDLVWSAASGDFNSETSDIDFIVDLGGYERGVSVRFFRFADALEAFFGRSVELITEEQIRNPYFRQLVVEQRVNVYQASDREEAA